MYLTRSEYDRGVNTFSPEGRLFQVSREQAGRRISTLQDSSMAHCCLSLSLSPLLPTGKRYISPKAEMMVNIASKLQQDVKAAVAPGGVATATTLDACQKEIFSLMVKDNFARFCKSTQGVALECMALARKAAGQE